MVHKLATLVTRHIKTVQPAAFQTLIYFVALKRMLKSNTIKSLRAVKRASQALEQTVLSVGAADVHHQCPKTYIMSV